MGVQKLSTSGYPKQYIKLPYSRTGEQREEEMPAGILGSNGTYAHTINDSPIFPLNGKIQHTNSEKCWYAVQKAWLDMLAAMAKAKLPGLKQYSDSYQTYDQQVTSFFSKNSKVLPGQPGYQQATAFSTPVGTKVELIGLSRFGLEVTVFTRFPHNLSSSMVGKIIRFDINLSKSSVSDDGLNYSGNHKIKKITKDSITFNLAPFTAASFRADYKYKWLPRRLAWLEDPNVESLGLNIGPYLPETPYVNLPEWKILWAESNPTAAQRKVGIKTSDLTTTLTKITQAGIVGSVFFDDSTVRFKAKPDQSGKYNPLPGQSVFGTGLVIHLVNKTTATTKATSLAQLTWLKNNAYKYGFAWTYEIPETDPDFLYTLHYYKVFVKPDYLTGSSAPTTIPGTYFHYAPGQDPKTITVIPRDTTTTTTTIPDPWLGTDGWSVPTVKMSNNFIEATKSLKIFSSNTTEYAYRVAFAIQPMIGWHGILMRNYGNWDPDAPGIAEGFNADLPENLSQKVEWGRDPYSLMFTDGWSPGGGNFDIWQDARYAWHNPPSDAVTVDEKIGRAYINSTQVVLPSAGSFGYKDEQTNRSKFIKFSSIFYLSEYKEAAKELKVILEKISTNKNFKLDLVEVKPGKMSKLYYRDEHLPSVITDTATYNSMHDGVSYVRPRGTQINNLNGLPASTKRKWELYDKVLPIPWSEIKSPKPTEMRGAYLLHDIFVGDLATNALAPYANQKTEWETYINQTGVSSFVKRNSSNARGYPYIEIMGNKPTAILWNKLRTFRSNNHSRSAMIVLLGFDFENNNNNNGVGWKGLSPEGRNSLVPPTSSTVVPTTVPGRIPTTTTTTVPPRIPTTTTTTVPPSSSTSIVKPKIIIPDIKPPDRYDPPTKPTVPDVNNNIIKIPLIIGDSIAVGISDRYDVLNTGTNTGEIVPNPYSVKKADNGWDGLFQLTAEGLPAVTTRINNCMSYLDKKNLAKNRIVWLSTGASNSSAASSATILSWIKRQFDLLKKYNSTVFVYGVSNQLDAKYPEKKINKQISDTCKQYGYTYMGGFDAPGDGLHPPSYNDIVDGLIGAIPNGTVYVPPTSTVPVPVVTIPSTTTTATTVLPNGSTASTTSTTVLPNGSTSTTITRYNPPYIRPPDQRDGPKYAPPSTVVTTTTTTLPNAAVTTTTVLSNGTTTSTTISPRPIPSTSTTVTPSTTIPVKVAPTPKTTYPDQRDGPQFAPPAPSVPEPKLLSYEITSFSTDSDPTRVNIDVRVTLKFDQPMQVNRGTISFVKKNTTKALARIDVTSSEVSFPDANTIAIAPKNVMPYDTEISVTIAANILKTKLGKSWPGNFGNNANQILFITITDPTIVPPVVPPVVAPVVPPVVPPVVAPVVPPVKPKPKPKPVPTPGLPISPIKPVVPEVPIVTPPNQTVINPGDGNIIIVDPVENEKTLQSNDGIWTREDVFSGTKFNAINQSMTVTRFAPHTSWALQFNMLDDTGVVKNIGRIGLERNASKCIGDPESPSVCFFSIYGGIKTLPDLAVDRYRQAACEARVTDHGPGMSLRNNLIWRPGDLFQFRVALSLLQQQEYVVTSQCLSTSRPISPAFSDTIYETDTDKIYMWNGLEWFLIASATLNIIQARTFENINTFIINGIWWSGLVWNKTLRRTYPLGNIFVPTDYTNIDAIKNFVKYSGPESEKSNVAERKASANFISPIGFSLDGTKGVYKAK